MLNNKRKCVIHEIITDTDSLTYEIETNDLYQDFWNDTNNLITVDILKTVHSIIKLIRKLRKV